MKLHPNCYSGPTSVQLGLAIWLGISWGASAIAQAPVGLPLDSANGLSNVAGAGLVNDAWIAMGREDANLNDVAILSEDHVLAVGDRGAILRSDSSGRKWQLLESPTTANLHGIRFSPIGFGLVVGGWIGSSTGMSHAVVLRSVDDGHTWQLLPAPSLPRLIGLRIQGNRCMAWGDYSPQWRTSLFESLDGGQSWRGVPLSHSADGSDDNAAIPLGHAVAAELSSSGHVGAVDVLGRAFFTAPDMTTEHARQSTIAEPARPVHALHHSGSRWLACGAEGELISSSDGETWTNVVLPLSPAARQLCQWQAITQVGDTLWVCGHPGSILLTSPDRGVSWQIRRTGQTLPLSAIQFVDKNRGWATGPMGLILATRDAGQTWYAQRHRARRLGVLAISDSAQRLPWAPLAAAAWDEQVAVAATVYQVVDPIEQAGFLPSLSASYRELAPQTGVAGLSLQSRTSSTASALSQRMALELRCWRPDVVLVSERSSVAESASGWANSQMGQALSSSNSGLENGSLENAALEAIGRGGQVDAVLSDELDLPAWHANKLAATCSLERSQFTEQIARLLRTPGIAIWDCLLPLSPTDRGMAEITGMRTIWTQSQAKSAFTALLGACPSTPENQRQVDIRNIGNFQLVMGRVHRNKSLERLVQTTSDIQSLAQWSSDLDFVMRSVPVRESAAVQQRLIQQLSVTRHWPQRQIAYQRLIATDPQSDLADWARLELLTLDVSDECAAWHKLEMPRVSGLQRADGVGKPIPVPGNRSESDMAAITTWEADNRARSVSWNASPFGEVSLPGDGEPAIRSLVVPASAAVPIFDPHAMGRQTSDQTSMDASQAGTDGLGAGASAARLFDARAAELSTLGAANSSATSPDAAWHQLLHATQLQSPLLLARPDMQLQQFCRQRPAQSSGQTSNEGQTRLGRLMSAAQLIGWPQMAQQELAVMMGHTSDLRWTTRARQTLEPPLLNGILDDPFWQRADVMELTEFDGNSPATQLRWAYDREYLYIGIVAPRGGDKSVLPVVERRDYDADLQGVDHVHLVLDTDRDYCTAIELAIAADGRTYDRCCGYSEYNPKWHVSVRSQADRWTAELAIELDDMTCHTDLSESAWAVSARRLRPGQASQSWSRLRSHTAYLQASGLLLFEPTADEKLSGDGGAASSSASPAER